ncbi:MAG: hypothetical protein GF375_07025 [Candidatus Omnitrophica bacterium]|nr:hypothetical protein [Candidatus Omnitrophota bacterium]MBD3269729.1 hypothetical protein [Candidatus Omnitrophota bacterium]
MEKKCINCSQRFNCRDSYISWLFFIIGLIAAIAIRSVTFLMELGDIYAKIAWYLGVGGFFIFFVYKFRINHRRSRFIKANKLMEKVSGRLELKERDYEWIGSLLCSLSAKKERINYFVIFGLSALALVIAIYMDFVR